MKGLLYSRVQNVIHNGFVLYAALVQYTVSNSTIAVTYMLIAQLGFAVFLNHKDSVPHSWNLTCPLVSVLL